MLTAPAPAPGTTSRRRPIQPWSALALVSSTALLAGWLIVRYVSQVNPVDFLVYRYGAEAALARAPLYDVFLQGPMMPTGGMPFTYTPFAAFLLGPTTWGDPRAAYLAWSALCMLALAWTLSRFIPRATSHRTAWLVGAVLAASATSMITQHIAFGQVGLLLMALVVADLTRSDASRLGRVLPRGVLVGLATAIKLTPGLFLVYFALTRQWRLLRWSVIAAAAATLVGWWALPGLSVDFVTHGLAGLSDRVTFMGGFATFGNNSLQGAMAAAHAPAALTYALVAAALVGGLLAAVVAHRRGYEEVAWVQVGLLAALISPVSWIHHWVFLLPAFLLLLRTRRRDMVAVVVVAWLSVCWGPGDHLLGDGTAVQVLLSSVQRECLLLASLASIVALHVTTRARRSEPEVVPSLDGERSHSAPVPVG